MVFAGEARAQLEHDKEIHGSIEISWAERVDFCTLKLGMARFCHAARFRAPLRWLRTHTIAQCEFLPDNGLGVSDELSELSGGI